MLKHIVSFSKMKFYYSLVLIFSRTDVNNKSLEILGYTSTLILNVDIKREFYEKNIT